MYRLKYTKQSLKDISKLKSSKLEAKTKKLLAIITNNPFQMPPPYEKLVGNYDGIYSRRINDKHRLCYTIDEKDSTITILSM
jgi:toxin YoeB